MQYAIGRKDGGVMIMSVLGGVDPVGEIAKWPPELQALVNISDIHPIASVPADRADRAIWTMTTLKP